MSSSSDTPSKITRDEVRQFSHTKQELVDNNPQLNEEETKTAIITDFVNLLEWHIPADGNMEYQFGNHNTNVVDYAFFHNGSSKLFVEAKSVGTSLTEKNRNQIKEYLLLDNVDLGILTNGEEYEFYRRVVNADGDVETQLIETITLANFPKYTVLLNIFSKSQVANETYKQRLERMKEIQIAKKALQNNQDKISNKLVGVLTESAGSITEQPARNCVVEFLDSVRNELDEMTQIGETESKDDPYDIVEQNTDVSFIDGEVSFKEEVSARDHLRQVIQVLFGQRLLTVDDLPISAGPTRYILNTEPKDQDGEPMTNSEEVVDGVYAELNASKNSIKQFIQTIINATKEQHQKSEATSVNNGGGTIGENEQIEIVDDIIVNKSTGEPIFAIKSLDTFGNGDSTQVGMYASDLAKGIPFIQRHRAWGFINIASKPEYFCIYLTRPHQQVQLIGVVEDVISKNQFLSEREIDRDPKEIADSKKVITFSEIYQLETPIPVGDISSRMQGLLYTSLGELKKAETTDDI